MYAADYARYICADSASPTVAQAQLVVDGETIADAKLLAAAKAEGQLLHYGTYPADAMKPVHARLRAETGIKVEYVRLPSQGMYSARHVRIRGQEARSRHRRPHRVAADPDS